MKNKHAYRIPFLFALLMLVFAACEKQEEPVVLPKVDGTPKLFTVSMGPSYDKQIFVNLTTQQLTVVDNNSWDLYFDSKAGGTQVYINGGKGVLIAQTGQSAFQPIANPASLVWKWDAACGQDDSLVLSDWRDKQTGLSHDQVYVIDRGAVVSGPSRYMQFKIVSSDAGGYLLRIADANGASVHDYHVVKDLTKVHVYFSFDNGGTTLNFEPAKDDWHICFLRYRWIYYEFNPPLLYTVTGIYINNYLVEAAVDSTLKFSEVDFASAHSLHFTRNRDEMGFEWKVYQFTTGKYVTRNYVNYVVKNVNPLQYHKMRFIDYYDDNGIKGTPRFEVQAF